MAPGFHGFRDPGLSIIRAVREQLRQVLVASRYSTRTAEAYGQWLARYLRFHRWHACSQGIPPDPRQLREPEIAAFLSHLAEDLDLSATSQNQALQALLFFYAEVLRQPLGVVGPYRRATWPEAGPALLSQHELESILRCARPHYQLPLRLMATLGLRVQEVIRLRMQDVDFSTQRLRVRNARGTKERQVQFPSTLEEPLGAAVDHARRFLESAQSAAQAAVAGSVDPTPAQSSTSAWLFPDPTPYGPHREGSSGSRDGLALRPERLRWALRSAARRAGIVGRVTPGSLRMSLAAGLAAKGIKRSQLHQRLDLGVAAMQRFARSE